MAHVKIIAPGSQAFDDVQSQIIKIARDGLYGNDLASFIKRAGRSLADEVRNLEFSKGEIPIHLIALGATEMYGPNRNGDGFKIAACRRYHDTFVKHARWYRNHANKNQAKSYGIVKLSAFNEAMKRIELIVALNGTKEAAEKNGGLVADKEIEKLNKGEPIAVSMSCKVAYDVCSECNNKAKNRSEYCKGVDEGGMCKGGGLKNRIGTVLANGRIVHADNPHPDFFDISDVYRGADRIAYVFGKAASGLIKSGADLAYELGVNIPPHLLLNSDDMRLVGMAKAAQLLAQAETELEANPSKTANWDRSFDPQVQLPIEFDKMSARDRNNLFNALAGQKIALSLRDFLVLTTGEDRVKCANLAVEVSGRLPGIFNRLLDNDDLESTLINNPYSISSELAPMRMQSLAVKYAADYSLSREHATKRIIRSALRNNNTPVLTKRAGVLNNSAIAASDEKLEKTAMQYALYKVGLTQAISNTVQDGDLQLTVDLLVRQNYLDQV